MKNTPILLLITLIVVVGVFVWSNIPSNNVQPVVNKNKLQIVTSFYPMYFFTSQIAGNKADVYNITPASAEPHDYEPTTQDIARIENSNVLVLNGGNLEAWGSKVSDNVKGSSVRVVIAGEGLADQHIVENGQTIQDPHIWLDPVLAKKEAAKITEALVSIDPKDTAYFYTNEKALDDRLDALDQSFRQGLSTCQKKDIVTSHAAFGYLARQYNLNQVAISGISPDAEPSLQKFAQLTDFVKQNNIKFILFESLVSPKLAQAIADETGAKTLVLDPLEGIPDAQLQQGENYFTIMRQNLNNLKIALECT